MFTLNSTNISIPTGSVFCGPFLILAFSLRVLVLGRLDLSNQHHKGVAKAGILARGSVESQLFVYTSIAVAECS